MEYGCGGIKKYSNKIKKEASPRITSFLTN